MELKEVRKNLLAQHETLRRLMVDLEAMMAKGAGFAPAITALRDALIAHNAAEEGVLVPVLETIDAWGPERVRVMKEHHHEEHELLVSQFTPDASAETVRGLLTELRSHMELEEKTMLSETLLKDDVVILDAD